MPALKICIPFPGQSQTGAAFGQEGSGTLHSALPTDAALGWLRAAWAERRLQLVALGFCVTHWLILGSLLRFPGFSSRQTVHTPPLPPGSGDDIWFFSLGRGISPQS